MAEQKIEEYTVVINGAEHTMLLTADDAAAYGDAATKADTKARTPSNKARSGESK